jgi:hypothetical protein
VGLHIRMGSLDVGGTATTTINAATTTTATNTATRNHQWGNRTTRQLACIIEVS